MIDLSQLQRVLTFFAHPDDETLAAGAIISKMTGLGVEVHTAIPATGNPKRKKIKILTPLDKDIEKLRKDCHRALKVLGVPAKHVYFGEFSDNEMDKHSLLEVVVWLEDLLDRVKPDLILTHHRFCTNIDHRICHEAAVTAARPIVDKHIPILCGEVPSSTGYLRPAQWEPNLYVEVTEQDLERKILAMECYRSEIRQDPHPRSREVLKALGKVRGSEAGFLFAEAFMIQRIFG
jgi:LmbE family N-acetylglucosaminyl deacetylase